jgi:hypothetical protein
VTLKQSGDYVQLGLTGYSADQHQDKPSVRMPHYPASIIDDAKAASLYAYIETFAEDEPALEDIESMQWILDWEESR